MLGIKTMRAPIGGKTAEDIRAAAARIASGRLSESEKASAKRASEELNHYNIKWEE